MSPLVGFLGRIISRILILFYFLLTSIAAISSVTYSATWCYSSEFTRGSSYETNLNILLSALVSNISTTKNGFYNFTSAGTDNQIDDDTAYGLVLCRGDVDPNDCRNCVQVAAHQVLENCTQKGAIIWTEKCMLHYSDEYIFSVVQLDPIMKPYGDQDSAPVIAGLQDLVNNVTSEAAQDLSGKKYATKDQPLTPIYTMAQFTPDLTVQDCQQCFSVANASLPISRSGAVVVTPSCVIRYDKEKFYRNLPPSPILAPHTPTGTKGTPPSPILAPTGTKGRNNLPKILGFSISISGAILVLIGAIYYHIARKKARMNDASIFERADSDDATFDSLQCSLRVLQGATNNFSNDNMIGRGGFGVVYKGTLPSGKHIAIKKLLARSGKVEEAFKNEMMVVAKLQHRNLVRLLAFCLAGGEMLLVFEYVPNKSLDYFIFDAENQEQLDWSKRLKIIVGIARGLLYLHEDSRLRIIHRDLKPSNILLDMEMNPKIADFGTARIFRTVETPECPQQADGTTQIAGVDQTNQITSKAGGTLGYIAPEYARTQRFSVKTDVYSFGVIILEIISGKRNRTFYRLGLADDLLSYAWMKWREGAPLELMDATLRDSYTENEVIRCINLGLLCVQKDPDKRPTMANIVHIILNSSSTNDLPMPESPASFADADVNASVPDQSYSSSVNEVSITEFQPR